MIASLEEIDKIDRRDIIAALRWWIAQAEWEPPAQETAPECPARPKGAIYDLG